MKKTSKIISMLVSALMFVQVLTAGAFPISAENLPIPTNISYSDNTIAWSHNKENVKTFRVNFYALSADGEYFYLQSNYDGDLKTNTSFSLGDELWAHFNDCMEDFELNPETTDILANVDAVSNNAELYRDSGVSDWVSLKTGTTYPPVGNDSDIPNNPAVEVLDWCGGYLGKAEYSKVQGCINYETVLYKDGVMINVSRTTWYNEQRNSMIANLAKYMTEIGTYYFIGRACDSQWNIVAEVTSNDYVYTNGELIPPKDLYVEDGILKWTNSPSSDCDGYKLEVWYSNHDIAGTKLGTENITGDIVIKDLFERYDFDSCSSDIYALTENLNVRVIAYSDNEAYQDAPSDYYIIEPIAVGTTEDRASYRLYWNNKLSVQGSRNYGGDMSDNFLTTYFADYASDIKKVSVNDYINSIGEKAFYNADSLEKLAVNYGVSDFGKEAFAECDNLSDVSFNWRNHQSVSFGEKVFYNCDKLESIALPQYTMAIAPYMFAECGALETINMQEHVYYIEEGAFKNCTKLTGVEFSDTLQRVEKNAFSGCLALTTVNLPARINKIGEGAFNCGNLESVYIYNKTAEIFDSEDTLKCSVIYGYKDSTAESYANKYSVEFRALDGDEVYTNENITDNSVKAIEGLDAVITQEDTEYAAVEGNTIVIKASASPVAENEVITTAIANNYSKYTAGPMINIDLNKIKTGAENTTTPITETDSLLSVKVEIPDSLANKDEYIVLREHNGVAEALKPEANADGEYISVSADEITIYAKKFSTYTILAKDTDSTPVRGGGGGSIKYTVKFESNGGSAVKTQSVSRNAAVKEPEIPVKEGFTFEGWYSDENLTAKFDFTAKLSKSITLYAKWSQTPALTVVLTVGQKEALINGETKANDVAPVIVNNRTMLPIRFIAEELGAEVGWEQETQTVKVVFEEITVTVVIGQDKAFVNGEEIALDTPAFIENNRTYLPIRFIMENLGADVKWDADNGKVIITK